MSALALGSAVKDAKGKTEMGTHSRQNTREDRRNDGRQKRERAKVEAVAGDIDGRVLLGTIDSILRAGGALRIGRTRDGSCWAFGVYGDGGDPYTEYIQPSEDVNAYLRELGEFFDQTGQGRPGQEPAR